MAGHWRIEMDETANLKSIDNIRRPFRFMLFFGIPFAGLLGANFLIGMPLLRANVDVISFAWIGIACLVNALQCDRVHCWFHRAMVPACSDCVACLRISRYSAREDFICGHC